MDLAELRRINAIVERDKADATYKYALLRGVIEICQKHRHLGETDAETCRFCIPLGILVEKWILYYYPLIESARFIPQKSGEPHGKHALAFRPQFTALTEYYRNRGGYSVFYHEYMTGTMPAGAQQRFLDLAKALRTTIASMPMKFLGYSQSHEYYSVFTPDRPLKAFPRGVATDRSLFIRSGGSFTLSRDLATVFEYFGTFISGEEGVLKKWAEFTVQVDRSGELTEAQVIELLTRSPETERAVLDARKVYDTALREHGALYCVWTGRSITSPDRMHVDHMLPFSIWKNNDLWNLLPTYDAVNAQKKACIPSPSLIEAREGAIMGYWDILHDAFPIRFEREISASLAGPEVGDSWMDEAFSRLVETSEYLIDVRGYEAWEI